MIKNMFFMAIALVTTMLNAQSDFLKVDPTTKELSLTLAGAEHLSELPLKCMNQEFPNKANHTASSEKDFVLLPHELHPSFYGCFDWHSSVHGHWMLVRLLKSFPNMANAAEIREKLNTNFQADKLKTEARYFDDYETAKLFERTYGWAWILKLDQELATWDDPQAQQWHKNLKPLTDKIVSLWMNFLPKQTYPNRTGVHPNTAFGLVFALDYARFTQQKEFEEIIVQKSKDYYLANKNAPANFEPDGTDFLSPSLEVADLMQRILPQKEFVTWFDAFFTKGGLDNVLKMPYVSDRTDYMIVHLDGLCLSRGWCMKSIAGKLPKSDKRRAQLLKSSIEHISKTIPHIANGNYGGEHWLASFAVYALGNN